MIDTQDILPLLRTACHSFEQSLARSVADSGAEALYVHAGEFAHHLLRLHQAKQCEEFPAIGAFIERLYAEGYHGVRELATIGFLEGIQNVWGNNSVDPEGFFVFLGPLAAAQWSALNRFWNGETPDIADVPRA